MLFAGCALEGGYVIGPAGGYVFFDKGYYSDGWRYLECAPEDIRAPWSKSAINVSTSTEIGAGKANTQAIVAALEAQGQEGCAAQLCAAFDFGGYHDWFLPSIDELGLIYDSLAELNRGGFDTDSRYWSSSQYNFDSVGHENEAFFIRLYWYGYNHYSFSNHYDGSYTYAPSDIADKTTKYSVRPIRAF
jgi:hypothetical protein